MVSIKKRLEQRVRVIRERTATARWLHDHPYDRPCPHDPVAAAAWRRARGIGPNVSAAVKVKRAKYDAIIMREKREREGEGT